MRKLTIKREKSFVGCLGKTKIYISDPTSYEIKMPLHTIDIETSEEKDEIISCRKIGEVKNGEEVTFEIGNESAVIFAIADKASKDYCNDCYVIKAGDEDISLSGSHKFNPANGNAFRFNGNDGSTAAINRKKSTGRGALVIIAAAIVGVLIGYFGMMGIMSGIGSKEKMFSAGDMNIILTESFEQQFVPGYAGVFGTKDVAVFVTTDPFDIGSVVMNFTEEQYAQQIINYNGFTDSKVITEGDLTYFTFDENNEDGESFRYFAYIYKSDDAYWMVQFATEKSRAKKYTDDIAKWAASVRFN